MIFDPKHRLWVLVSTASLCAKNKNIKHFQLKIFNFYIHTIHKFMVTRFHNDLFQAGLESDQISIALESEAASIWCQNIPLSAHGGRQCAINVPGTKYMVCDLGGELFFFKPIFDEWILPSLSIG